MYACPALSVAIGSCGRTDKPTTHSTHSSANGYPLHADESPLLKWVKGGVFLKKSR